MTTPAQFTGGPLHNQTHTINTQPRIPWYYVLHHNHHHYWYQLQHHKPPQPHTLPNGHTILVQPTPDHTPLEYHLTPTMNGPAPTTIPTIRNATLTHNGQLAIITDGEHHPPHQPQQHPHPGQ